MVMDSEDVASAPSTPMTPGTPGAPLFGGFKSERSGNRRPSLLKSCKCFSVEAWAMEEGTLPSVFCSLPPPVSLARKVRERENSQKPLLHFVCFASRSYAPRHICQSSRLTALVTTRSCIEIREFRDFTHIVVFPNACAAVSMY